MNEFVLSSGSATIIIEAIKPLTEKSQVEVWLLPCLTLVASVSSAFAAYFSYKVARNTYISEILKLFFDISIALPLSYNGALSNHHKQLICNYFDFVCHLIEKKRMSENDIEPLKSVMREKGFVLFIKNYRRRHGTSYFNAYERWLQRNSDTI